MKRLILSLVFLSLIGVSVPFVMPLHAVEQEPVPTLVPPTLVPTQDAGMFDTIPTESGVARIQQDGRVRVGILYNESPFGYYNVRGEVSGFDADLGRDLAELWGIEVEFVQVTRQTAIDILRFGTVDLLIAAQVHRRELDTLVEFTHSYVSGSESLMVRADDTAAALADMANRRIGVVIGTPAEAAVTAWLGRTGIQASVQTYLNLDQAAVALLANEVDGIVDSRTRLLRPINQPELVRILEEPVAQEPYAIAVRRQDVSMRNLVNQSLQHLYRSGRLYEIHIANLTEVPFRDEVIPVWANLPEDAPRPDQFSSEVSIPQQYTLPRLMSNRVIRVAGVFDMTPETREGDRRLDALNRALIDSMAARWGVTVEYIPNSAANALDLVAAGEADIALGVQPDWTWADRVDFTGSYLIRGYRLMVRANSDIVDFTGLRGGQWVAVHADDPAAATRATDEAADANARIEILQTQDAAFAILVDNNADVGFGDVLWLRPMLDANPDLLRLTEEWYGRTFVGMAVQRNDIDFRLLVEYTMQDLAQDGTLQTLLQPVMLAEDIPAFEIWPGLGG